MNSDELLALIKTRRSVRKFLADPVADADLEKLLDAAQWAPSGSNNQNWFFVIVRSAVVKEKMAAAIQAKVASYARRISSPRANREFVAYGKYYSFFTQAPVVIAVVKKPYVSLNLRIMERYDIPVETRSSSDVQGPSAGIENLMLMAHALGYGSCWMTGPLIARRELEKLLAIEAPDELLALVPLGKPAAVPGVPGRKNVKEICRCID